jgi:hypothetical protein
MDAKLIIFIVLLSIVTLIVSVPVLNTDDYQQLDETEDEKLYELLLQRDGDLQKVIDEVPVTQRPKSTRSAPKDAKGSHNNRQYVILLGK